MTTISTDLVPTSSQLDVLARFETKRSDVEDLIAHSKAKRTLEGYESDWRQLEAFAAAEGLHVPPLVGHTVDLAGTPVMPELIALWVASSEGELKPGSINRRMAAVKHFHRQNKLMSPTDHPDVRDTIAGYSRKHHAEPTQAEPISGPQLVAMLEGLGTDLRGLRDRALLTVGFLGGFRRSELVGIEVAHITETDKGMAIRLAKSKTDQEGKGRTVAIAYQPRQVCAVRALRAWMKAANITSGPVFRGINGHVHDEALSARTVGRVVKAGAERIGLDPDLYSAHSLRAGHVTWAMSEDVKAQKVGIRATTGHRSDTMLDLYNRVPTSEAFEVSSTAYMAKAFEKMLGLQNL